MRVLSRDDEGVLVVRLHRQGGPLMWGGAPHAELPELFAAIASDRDNRVVILTGTGDTFIGMTGSHFGPDLIDPGGWDRVLFEGLRLVNQLLDIDVPMTTAVNGPAVAHSELGVLCDVVLASEDAYLEDAAHLAGGLLPGDSMQIIWPMLIGHNRGRAFLLTGQRISAQQALDSAPWPRSSLPGSCCPARTRSRPNSPPTTRRCCGAPATPSRGPCDGPCSTTSTSACPWRRSPPPQAEDALAPPRPDGRQPDGFGVPRRR